MSNGQLSSDMSPFLSYLAQQDSILAAAARRTSRYVCKLIDACDCQDADSAAIRRMPESLESCLWDFLNNSFTMTKLADYSATTLYLLYCAGWCLPLVQGFSLATFSQIQAANEDSETLLTDNWAKLGFISKDVGTCVERILKSRIEDIHTNYSCRESTQAITQVVYGTKVELGRLFAVFAMVVGGWADNEIDKLPDASCKSPIPEVRKRQVWDMRVGASRREAVAPSDAALEYDDILMEFADEEHPLVKIEVAKTFVSLANLLIRIEGADEALDLYDDMLCRYSDLSAPIFQEEVARCLVNKAHALSKLGRTDECLAVYDDLMERYDSGDNPIITELVTQGLLDKAQKLEGWGRADESLATYDTVAARCKGDRNEDAIVAESILGKAAVYGRVGDSKKLKVTMHDALNRFGRDNSRRMREVISRKLVDLSASLGKCGREDDALAVCDQILERFGDDRYTEVYNQVAITLFNKAEALSRMPGRKEEALVTFDDLFKRFFNGKHALVFKEPRMHKTVALVAHSFCLVGQLLSELHRIDEANAAYDALLQHFGESNDPEIRHEVNIGLHNKAVLSSNTGNYEDGLALFETLLSRYENGVPDNANEQIAQALFGKGIMLDGLSRNDEALAAFDDAIQRCEADDSPNCQVTTAKALASKVAIFCRTKDFDKALSTCDDMSLRFGDNDNAHIVASLNGTLSFVLVQMWNREQDPLIQAELLEKIRKHANLSGKFYNLACVLALANGGGEEAFRFLEQSLEVGEIQWSIVEADSDWSACRNHDEYKVLKERFGNS